MLGGEKIKLYALGLLLVSSFNVLGELCSIDEGKYEIISSIYLSKNDTCICKEKYEFSPYVFQGKLSSTKEQDNSFADTGTGEKWQCVMPKDNAPKDNEKLSSSTWIIPLSIFAATAGTSFGYYALKLKNKISDLSGSTPNTNTIEISEGGYLVPTNQNPNPMLITNTDSQVDLGNVLIDSNPTEYAYAYPSLNLRPKNTSSTEYTDAYSPTELGAMEPVNTYELANQVGSIIERSARSEINGRNVAFDKGVNGAPEEIYYEINEQEMLSDEEISALREKNAYPETNVQDIEPRATADTRIRARSPGSKGEFTKISNDVNSGSSTKCDVIWIEH